MRWTLIAAASAAALATAMSPAFSLAQQPQAPTGRQEAPAASQQQAPVESGRRHTGDEGAMQRRRNAQTPPSGERPMRAQSAEERDRQGESGRNAGQAETEKMNSGRPAGAQAEPNNRKHGAVAREQRTGEPNQAEKRGTEGAGQAAGTEKGAAQETSKTTAGRPARDDRNGEAQTGRNEMKGDRQGDQTGRSAAQGDRQGDQNARAETHVSPQDVRVRGNARLSNDRAAQIADAVLATATPQNVGANVVVGRPLPGQARLLPLPPTIVDLVPEYRDYDYVVVNDEIAIVQPSTRNVVEVIDTGGGGAADRGGRAMAGTGSCSCPPP